MAKNYKYLFLRKKIFILLSVCLVVACTNKNEFTKHNYNKNSKYVTLVHQIPSFNFRIGGNNQ